MLDRLSAHLARYCNVYAAIAIATTFAALLGRALAHGGRWDLYDAVGMGDRVGGAFGYSLGGVDRFEPSTPYFLGASIISYLVGLVAHPVQVEILLLTATLLVFTLQGCLFLVYRRIGGQASFLPYGALSLAVTALCLNKYLDYALEFKPDTPSLIFFSLAAAVVLSDLALVKRLALIVLLIAASLLFKQQIGMAIGALALGRLFWGGPIWRRLADVAAIGIGGCLGLLASLSVPNAVFFAVISHAGRTHLKLLDMEHAFLLITVVILGGIILLIRGPKSTLSESLRVGKIWPYSLAAVLWFLVSLAGARNFGGNSGNTAVGLALFLPFAVLLLDKAQPWLRSLMFIALTLYSTAFLVASHWYSRYQTRIHLEAEIGDQLQRAGVKTALVSGDSYIAARRGGVASISEIDTWAHIHNGVSRDKVVKDGVQLVDELKPDAIVCMQTCSVFLRYKFDPAQMGYRAVTLPDSKSHDILYLKP